MIFYKGNYTYVSHLLVDLVQYIKDNDQDAVIVLQSDHGIHTVDCDELKRLLNVNSSDCRIIRNSMFSAISIPEKYKNGDESVLNNPLNISTKLCHYDRRDWFY